MKQKNFQRQSSSNVAYTFKQEKSNSNNNNNNNTDNTINTNAEESSKQSNTQNLTKNTKTRLNKDSSLENFPSSSKNTNDLNNIKTKDLNLNDYSKYKELDVNKPIDFNAIGDKLSFDKNSKCIVGADNNNDVVVDNEDFRDINKKNEGNDNKNDNNDNIDINEDDDNDIVNTHSEDQNNQNNNGNESQVINDELVISNGENTDFNDNNYSNKDNNNNNNDNNNNIENNNNNFHALTNDNEKRISTETNTTNLNTNIYSNTNRFSTNRPTSPSLLEKINDYSRELSHPKRTSNDNINTNNKNKSRLNKLIKSRSKSKLKQSHINVDSKNYNNNNTNNNVNLPDTISNYNNNNNNNNNDNNNNNAKTSFLIDDKALHQQFHNKQKSKRPFSALSEKLSNTNLKNNPKFKNLISDLAVENTNDAEDNENEISFSKLNISNLNEYLNKEGKVGSISNIRKLSNNNNRLFNDYNIYSENINDINLMLSKRRLNKSVNNNTNTNTNGFKLNINKENDYRDDHSHCVNDTLIKKLNHKMRHDRISLDKIPQRNASPSLNLYSKINFNNHNSHNNQYNSNINNIRLYKSNNTTINYNENYNNDAISSFRSHYSNIQPINKGTHQKPTIINQINNLACINNKSNNNTINKDKDKLATSKFTSNYLSIFSCKSELEKAIKRVKSISPSRKISLLEMEVLVKKIEKSLKDTNTEELIYNNSNKSQKNYNNDNFSNDNNINQVDLSYLSNFLRPSFNNQITYDIKNKYKSYNSNNNSNFKDNKDNKDKLVITNNFLFDINNSELINKNEKKSIKQTSRNKLTYINNNKNNRVNFNENPSYLNNYKVLDNQSSFNYSNPYNRIGNMNNTLNKKFYDHSKNKDRSKISNTVISNYSKNDNIISNNKDSKFRSYNNYSSYKSTKLAGSFNNKNNNDIKMHNEQARLKLFDNESKLLWWNNYELGLFTNSDASKLKSYEYGTKSNSNSNNIKITSKNQTTGSYYNNDISFSPKTVFSFNNNNSNKNTIISNNKNNVNKVNNTAYSTNANTDFFNIFYKDNNFIDQVKLVSPIKTGSLKCRKINLDG